MFELESADLFKKMRELPELSNSLCRSAVENIGQSLDFFINSLSYSYFFLSGRNVRIFGPILSHLSLL